MLSLKKKDVLMDEDSAFCDNKEQNQAREIEQFSGRVKLLKNNPCKKKNASSFSLLLDTWVKAKSKEESLHTN